MTNFINIGYITKVNIANLNSWEGTGGNITPIKKVTDFEWNSYSYISWQALRRYMKTTLQQLGKTISAVNERGEPIYTNDENNEEIKKWFDKMLSWKWKEEWSLEESFKKYIDIDLFGFMFPNWKRRWSPVKVSAMLSTNAFKWENDYLTRKQLEKSDGKKSWNIVQTEIETLNYYRGNIVIDVHAIWKDINEYDYSESNLLSDEEKNERINDIIEMIKNLNWGSKQARLLEDISPKFVIWIKQKTWNPFLLNSLNVDEEWSIDINNLLEVLKDNEEYLWENKENIVVGILDWIFSNEEDVKNKFKEFWVEVEWINKALNKLKY